MGFFSVNCLGCGLSIRSAHTHGARHWTSFAVAFPENGPRLKGEYDGYGRLVSHTDEDEPFIGFKPVSAYHRACWVVLGQPDHFTVESDSAGDQGYFVASEPKQPLTLEALAELREVAKRERDEARQARKDALEAVRKDYIARGEAVPEWLA